MQVYYLPTELPEKTTIKQHRCLQSIKIVNHDRGWGLGSEFGKSPVSQAVFSTVHLFTLLGEACTVGF